MNNESKPDRQTRKTNYPMRFALLMMLALCLCVQSHSQSLFSNVFQSSGVGKEATDGIHSVSDKSLYFLQKEYGRMTASIDKQSQKMLNRMQRKEEKLKNNLYRKDSLKAAQLFAGSEAQYKQLQTKLSLPLDSTKQFPLKAYIPDVDSLQTALRFLQQKGINLPTDKLSEVCKASNELQALQSKLQRADDIEAFVKQRERELKEQLQNSGLIKQLKSINKEAFYYQQRVQEYKQALNNPEKMKEKIMSAVRDSRFFQSFMQKHSYLAKLFPMPDNNDLSAVPTGLQTRASIQQVFQQRFGASAFTPTVSTSGNSGGGSNYLQSQMQTAQAQLGQLQDKMSKLGIKGASGDMTMPDFKPNSQHTKSFLQRIEYGMNMQSERSHSIVPTTSEMALTAGYKLNDKSTIGLGASYRMGWGNGGIKHIKLSSEGIGLRSYVDIKAKGSIWITGGYEMNYMQSFSKYQQLYNLNMWQRSGLIGLTKKYKVGKKENKLQLLWDFLSYSQIPRTQPIKFRVGFSL